MNLEWLKSLREGGWKNIHVPLGGVAAVLAVGYAAAAHIDTRYVLRAEFRTYKNGIESRMLETEIRRLELETLRLNTKREAYPHLFDAVDRAMLARQEAMLSDAKADLKSAQNRSRREEEQ